MAAARMIQGPYRIMNEHVQDEPNRLLPYYPTAARRAYLVVPEIGVLKWFLELSSIASVNLESECRF